LIRDRAEIVNRIGTVRRTLVGLTELFGESKLNDEILKLVERKTGKRQLGLTEVCRDILVKERRSLNGNEVYGLVRQRLYGYGVPRREPQ
jgi:hypothetical protein